MQCIDSVYPDRLIFPTVYFWVWSLVKLCHTFILSLQLHPMIGSYRSASLTLNYLIIPNRPKHISQKEYVHSDSSVSCRQNLKEKIARLSFQRAVQIHKAVEVGIWHVTLTFFIRNNEFVKWGPVWFFNQNTNWIKGAFSWKSKETYFQSAGNLSERNNQPSFPVIQAFPALCIFHNDRKCICLVFERH